MSENSLLANVCIALYPALNKLLTYYYVTYLGLQFPVHSLYDCCTVKCTTSVITV